MQLIKSWSQKPLLVNYNKYDLLTSWAELSKYLKQIKVIYILVTYLKYNAWLYANTLGKGMNPIILPPAMGK